MRKFFSFAVCCVLVGMLGGQVRAERIRFLVAELPGEVDHNDSYVVTIDEQDAAALAHARELVAWVNSGANMDDAPDGRIVVTQMTGGADGINRDHRAPGAPAWSWHPIGEVSFADTTIEILDGWPTFVESDVGGWIANTRGDNLAEVGQIGFWGYTIVEELGPVVPEPGTWILLASAALTVGIAFPHRMRRAS